MKGIVFTLLQQVVTDEHGEDTWDALLDAAEVDGAYTAVATYPDEEMTALVGAASNALGISGDDVLIWFGRKCMPIFSQTYPHVFEGHTSARTLILALNDVIHPEVRKLFPGAYVPEFEYDDAADGPLTITYSSKRQLCAFAEGLINGAADHFGEVATVTHASCTKKGDNECVIRSTFARAA